MKTIDAAKARQRYAETLSRVQFGRERLVLSRGGKPAVALVPVEEALFLENKGDLFALQDELEDLEAALKKKGKRLARPLARMLHILDDLESRLASAVIARHKSEAAERGETPVPWEEVRKRLRL